MDLQKQNGDVMDVPASESNGAERREDGFDSGPGIRTPGDPNSDEKKKNKSGISRAEIDTSSPFGSVKEAATRFGGIGFWRPAAAYGRDSQVTNEVGDMAKVEMEAAQLERDFVAKERETHAILEELESTMTTKEQLKAKLQHEEDLSVVREAGKESNGLTMCPSSAPGLILLELKQAKLNLGRTTHDLDDIRAAVESYKENIEKERILLEKTKKRVASNSTKVSFLEHELNRLRQRGKNGNENDALEVTWWDLQKLSSETEQLKKARDAAKSEVIGAMREIEQKKAKIKTVESRLVAARKIKEAARATEAAALAEINALNKSERNPEEGITLSAEEYSALTSRAREAEETCKRRVVGAEHLVDEATNVLKTEILRKVEKATEEAQSRKGALERALNRLESANREKLEVEEAMRRWRSDHGQRKSSVQNSTKFKNSTSSQHQKGPPLLDVKGPTLVHDDDSPSKAFKSTLSIGQILSRKLLSKEDYENQMCAAKKSNGKQQRASLSHLLCKSSSVFSLGDEKENARKLGTPRRKKKKFSLFRISLVRKQGKNVTSKLKASYFHV